MKLSNQWKTLSRDAKQLWTRWAKSNPVFLDTDEFRRVSGHKAFTIVLNNRLLAGDPANIVAAPSAPNWISDALTLADAGPFTAGAGYVGFRISNALTNPTQWFVWASKPVDATDTAPLTSLRFIKH